MSKEELKKAIQQATDVVGKEYAIKSVRLFGSQARGTATADSDIDLIIEFEPDATVGLFALYEIQNIYEQHLKREADITTPAGLDDFVRDQVLAEAEVVYERR